MLSFFYLFSVKYNRITSFPLPFAENLILTADHKTVKLADFGLAREESLTEMMTAETGTYRWMAPEVLNLIIVKHYSYVNSFKAVYSLHRSTGFLTLLSDGSSTARSR